MDKLAGQELSMEEVAIGFASGNFRGARVLAAVLDGEGGAVEREGAHVAHLPARLGVEARPVEHDPREVVRAVARVDAQAVTCDVVAVAPVKAN